LKRVIAMRCPKCDTELSCEKLHDQAVEQCPRCDGSCFAATQLGCVVRQADVPDSPTASVVEPSDGLTCPGCGGAMTPTNYAHDSGVFINRCTACGGTWLESGQLALLAKYRAGTPAINAPGQAMADDLRSSNRWLRVRRVLRSRLLSGIIAIAYTAYAATVAADPDIMLRPGTYRLRGFMVAIWFPVLCIWFPDAMAKGALHSFRGPLIDPRTPGDCVAIVGWIALLAPAVGILIIHML